MSAFALVVLGFVQGVCEFLPVSSSGHLVLLSSLFGIKDSLFVSIILHVATLFAVVFVLRKEVWQIIRHPFSKESIMIVLATISTCVIAILLMPFITSSFEGKFLPVFFLISAGLLLFVRSKIDKGGQLSYKKAIVIGLAQGFAIFPGLSRSGTTISAGLISGASKENSSKFSFLISLPIILASLLVEIYKIVVRGEAISVDPFGMVLSFIIAFLVGIISIKFMLKITNKKLFKYFSFYLIIIAIISAIILW